MSLWTLLDWDACTPARPSSLALYACVRGQGTRARPDAEDLSVQAFLQAVETSISTMDRQRWIRFAVGQRRSRPGARVLRRDGAAGHHARRRQGARSLAAAGHAAGRGLPARSSRSSSRPGRAAASPRGGSTSAARAARTSGAQPWRILAEERLASIEGLHRLSLQRREAVHRAATWCCTRSTSSCACRPATCSSPKPPEGVTALVLLGEGTMVFQPTPKEEKGQLKLFAGTETLETPFTAAFVRINPYEFDQRVGDDMLDAGRRSIRATLRRALRRCSTRTSPKSFNLDLSDLSRDVWSLLPQPGDFVAEVRTRRFDDLTYARSTGEPEDVTLFQRARKRNIAAYASEAEAGQPRPLLRRRRPASTTTSLDYDVDAAFYPGSRVDGRPHAAQDPREVVRARRADAAVCRQPQRVVGHRATNSGGCCSCASATRTASLVNLPTPVPRDFTLTLTVTYSGRLARSSMTDESISMDRGARRAADRSAATQPTICRSCRRSRSGCSAIAATGIRRPGHRLRHARTSASPCRPSTPSSPRRRSRLDRRRRLPPAALEDSARDHCRASRIRSRAAAGSLPRYSW